MTIAIVLYVVKVDVAWGAAGHGCVTGQGDTRRVSTEPPKTREESLAALTDWGISIEKNPNDSGPQAVVFVRNQSLAGRDMSGFDLTNVQFHACVMDGASLRGATLLGFRIEGGTCVGLDLTGANAEGVRLAWPTAPPCSSA